jgi:hypothetical protein
MKTQMAMDFVKFSQGSMSGSREVRILTCFLWFYRIQTPVKNQNI